MIDSKEFFRSHPLKQQAAYEALLARVAELEGKTKKTRKKKTKK